MRLKSVLLKAPCTMSRQNRTLEAPAFELGFHGEYVSIQKGKHVTLVPLAQVAEMTPAEETAQAPLDEPEPAPRKRGGRRSRTR